MKILFVSPSNAIGGAEMSLLQMAKFLHQNGHSVYVAMPPSAEQAFKNQLRPFVEAFLFVPLMAWYRIRGAGFFHEMKGWAYRVFKSRGGWLNAPFRIARFVRHHKIELVHTNTIMALDGALAAKIAGIPHIQHLREITGYGPDAIFTMPGQSHPRTFGRLWGLLHTVLIANSFYTKNAYGHFLPDTRIQVVYNSIEASEEDFNSREAANKHENELSPIPQPNEPQHSTPHHMPEFTIGLVANVTSKVKNHRFFIQTAGLLSQQIPNLDFVVFGKMPPESDPYLQVLRSEIVEQNLSSKLDFKGLYDNTTVMYRQIDILLHTYPYESFGRVFIEAMARGIPVVAMSGGGANEIIRDGETGLLFEKDDLYAASRSVRALCEDPELYARIAKNGRLFAQRFRSEATGTQLLDVYKAIEKPQ